MRGTAAKKIRKIIGFNRETASPFIKRLYRKTKKKYVRLSAEHKQQFLQYLENAFKQQ